MWNQRDNTQLTIDNMPYVSGSKNNFYASVDSVASVGTSCKCVNRSLDGRENPASLVEHETEEVWRWWSVWSLRGKCKEEEMRGR